MSHKAWAKGVSLMELILAISLMGLVVLTGTGIDVASRRLLSAQDKEAYLLRELSPVMEHMIKQISLGIGSIDNSGLIVEEQNNRLKVRLDRDQDARPDDNGNNDWIAYRYWQGQREIRYYPQYPPNGWPNRSFEVIAQKITDFSLTQLNDFSVNISITACYEPGPSCGTRDNPTVTISSTVALRSQSIR